MDDNNPYVMLAKDAVEDGLWDGLGDVRVLNLSLKDSDVEAQDQLMLVPSAGHNDHGSARTGVTAAVWKRYVARRPWRAAVSSVNHVRSDSGVKYRLGRDRSGRT